MDFLNALPRVIAKTSASAGAANTAVNLAPDSGKLWYVVVIWAYHAAGGARAAGWYWTDPDTPAGAAIGPSIAALAANTPLLFPGFAAVGAQGGDIGPIGPVWATELSYPSFVWTATGAGENGYVKALVLEYSGVGKIG